MAGKPRHTCRPSTLQCLLWALRCLGLYCFMKPTSATAADAMEISLPLLLWAIFVKIFQITQTVSDYFRTETRYTGSVGALTANLNVVISTTTSLLGQTVLLINGPILNQILLECEEEASLNRPKDVDRSVTIFSMERIMSLLFYCSFTVGLIAPFFSLALIPDTYKAEIVVFFVHCTTITAGMMLTATLFREVLVIASRKLNVDFLLDENILRGGVAELDRGLDALERTIHKVELLRRKIVDFFLSAVSMLLCGLIFTVITNLYCAIRTLTDYYEGQEYFLTITYLIIGITTLFHFCYSTHHFSQQVQRVSSQLRDLRLAVRGEEDRAQLHYLIWTLENMETFDMGSWYHLGPNTLVSVTTFVVTYLVVLLQVGDYKTNVEPSAMTNITTF